MVVLLRAVPFFQEHPAHIHTDTFTHGSWPVQPQLEIKCFAQEHLSDVMKEMQSAALSLNLGGEHQDLFCWAGIKMEQRPGHDPKIALFFCFSCVLVLSYFPFLSVALIPKTNRFLLKAELYKN